MTKFNAHETPDQCTLWDQQHATRGVSLENSDVYKHTPNTSAVEFSRHLRPNSRILEIGSASGRDARYWADLGHEVYAVDFSQIALDQLKFLAMEQGIIEFVSPILHDITNGTLPSVGIPDSIDGFYARSALHIDDTQIYRLAFELNTILKPGAKILIEGKGPNDKKIARSEPIGRHLVIDYEEGGHVRRVWTCQFSQQLCKTMKWDILELRDRQEKWNGTPATFMRLIAQKGYQNA